MINCQIVQAYEARKESKFQDYVQTPDNPFVKDKSITGLGNKVKKSPLKRQMRKLKDTEEEEKDEDIKRELRKGNIVLVIENAFDY